MVRQPHPASLLAAVLLTVAALVLIAPGTGLVAPAAEVSASPALDAVDLMPGQPLSISVQHGTIVALSVTDQTGSAVPGQLATDGSSWSYAGNLGYGKTYTATGAAIGADGQVARISGSYRTVKPVEEVTPTIFPGTGDVVGVAAPVIVTLSSEPADRQAVEDRLQITTTPHVEGSWAWIQHDGRDGPSLDWRPREYWPSGTQVHVEVDLFGMDLGGGHFGGAKQVSDFSIGRNQVVLADATTHQIVVQQDGHTVATYPASYGSGDDIGDPNRVTRSGVHVVTDMQETTTMSNPDYGYSGVTEHWAVRISNNGEFIHQNADTVDDQGSANVSHGCINLAPADAEAYFRSAIYGDPVEVTGTSVQLSEADGDLYDWAIPWDQWQLR